MVLKAGTMMNYLDLSACQGLRVKRQEDSLFVKLQPDICFISPSHVTIEHEEPLDLQVGEKVDLQLHIMAFWHSFPCRVVWVIQQQGKSRLGLEFDAPLPPWLLHFLAGSAKRSWWSFPPAS